MRLREQSLFSILVLSAFSPAFGAEPSIAVSPVLTDKGEAMHVRASIRIAAKPESVWTVVSNCQLAPKIIPHLESCRVSERDARGRWDIREHVINPPLLPKMRTVVRNDFDAPRKLSFRLLSGDMKVSDGAWTLQPEGGGTLLLYDAIVAPGFSAPQFLVTRSIKTDFPKMLREIERASLQQSR
jgi:hypothetical protein